MHAEASHFLAARYPNAVVLTAWPASDELARPWLGYVGQPFRLVRIEALPPRKSTWPPRAGMILMWRSFSQRSTAAA